MTVSLLSGHRPHSLYSDERVPINIAPEVRDRLNNLLLSPAFMGRGVGFSAFIDRACEAAESEYSERLTSQADVPVSHAELSPGDGRQWCPACKRYHRNVGERTDAGKTTRPCPLLEADDPRNHF